MIEKLQIQGNGRGKYMTKKIKGRLLFVWSIIVFTLTFKLENQFELGFWKYMIISVPLFTIGNIIIDKFVKVDE
ncbi:hypothetical protein GC105_00900 [Alkalibaculum sp. M08DMB]|uniref:Uncharacterized protein n=2 Tax=Alkalibaculum sporogenes TaxID=2655001 RepID=A0A6A7K4P0_9FIRM|nr:hypothetical protein [Alkalibaculum sporogenes]